MQTLRTSYVAINATPPSIAYHRDSSASDLNTIAGLTAIFMPVVIISGLVAHTKYRRMRLRQRTAVLEKLWQISPSGKST